MWLQQSEPGRWGELGSKWPDNVTLGAQRKDFGLRCQAIGQFSVEEQKELASFNRLAVTTRLTIS